MTQICINLHKQALVMHFEMFYSVCKKICDSL